jgi:hypothetical protein
MEWHGDYVRQKKPGPKNSLGINKILVSDRYDLFTLLQEFIQ